MQCREITLEDVKRLPPIFSSFETTTVFRLATQHENGVHRWILEEERLKTAYRKRYDSGKVEDWIESYLESAPIDALRFFAAGDGDVVDGLLTWQKIDWNDTLWLLDIRTRKERRGTGVGSALMDWLKAEAKRLRVRGIAVETQINNYPAIRFYQRHQFRISGFNDHLYTNRDSEKQDVALFLFWESR